ncbi:Pkinase-domain-containing protein [Gymnopus androsaceus JB14]|uniref:mitogen-activated protein kinase n=1 Tax=Gymnopus androsaceus JB14 TaxID=1447944 RepID=A0A6A4GNS8_9AGAR|nr:Pkinase-domain-containing protein [Gymnopus androsaceus JB14]
MNEHTANPNLFNQSSHFNANGLFIAFNNQPQVPPSPPATSSQAIPIPATDLTGNQSEMQQLNHIELYSQLLLPQRRGYPLWKPRPDNSHLPEKYRKDGVHIGDVGFLNSWGGFEFLFNVCHPADHELNTRGVPPDFKILELDEDKKNISETLNEFTPGSRLASQSSHFTQLRLSSPDGKSPILGVPEEVGAGLSFSSSATKGALLILPEGAKRSDHLQYAKFEAYAANNAHSWYRYANGPLAREVHHSAIYLITGFDKARAWGVASFQDAQGKVCFEFVPKMPASTKGSPKYWFRRYDFADCDAGDDDEYQNQSGSVFLRGFRIAINEKRNPFIPPVVEKIQGMDANKLLNQKASSNLSDYQSAGLQQAYPVTESPTSPTVHGNSALSNNVSLNAPFDHLARYQPYHPSDVINRWILNEHKEVDVAITHDNVWTSAVQKHEEEMPADQDIIHRIRNHIKFGKSGSLSYASFDLSDMSQISSVYSLPTMLPSHTATGSLRSSTTVSRENLQQQQLVTPTSSSRAISEDLNKGTSKRQRTVKEHEVAYNEAHSHIVMGDKPSQPSNLGSAYQSQFGQLGEPSDRADNEPSPSVTRDSFSDESLRRRGYHTLQSSFGKAFHVEKRWKLVREMGSGAYGVVISAADEISGETVAIKLVTRVFEKVQLAKRALREIVLLRHFASHENITGLIDVDAISPDFNEMYIFMEPMEADLHQIIKSGQQLTNEHTQYFLYQILPGMKYIHSAKVIHRDLKPGNLLVNSDCELKICDFGLSRGFDAEPDENASHLTEYVATRWYRAPEIMLAFRRYNTAIDVWSIGCIFAELLMGKPLFKGKDYVDQLNKILNVLGSPDDAVIAKIGSDKAQAYVRSLPLKITVPLKKIIPHADSQALDLLKRMLSFDPDERITVTEALEHPWLSSYHDITDEPECAQPFDAWRYIETLETIDDFRDALWKEIQEYRQEVRGVNDLSGMPIRRVSGSRGSEAGERPSSVYEPVEADIIVEDVVTEEKPTLTEEPSEMEPEVVKQEATLVSPPSSSQVNRRSPPVTPTDPLIRHAARRSSIIQPTTQGSTFGRPFPSSHAPSYSESPSVAFPSRGEGYVLPARSRTGSIAGGGVGRRLLRTLFTVSIYESAEGLAGGLAELAPIGEYIMDRQTTGADAPASEMPREFGIDEAGEEDLDNWDDKFIKREGKFFFPSSQNSQKSD